MGLMGIHVSKGAHSLSKEVGKENDDECFDDYFIRFLPPTYFDIPSVFVRHLNKQDEVIFHKPKMTTPPRMLILVAGGMEALMVMPISYEVSP